VEVLDEELLRLLDDPGPGDDVSRGDFAVARQCGSDMTTGASQRSSVSTGNAQAT
jgi:hypothetical protein